MKVLLTHNSFSKTGGAEVFYHEIGRVLQNNGDDVAYFSAQDKNAVNEWSGYFPQVASYNNGGVLSKAINLPRMIYNRQAKAAMKQLISEFKPDIIHAFAIYVKLTPSILDAAREAGVPVIMSCNDYKHICPNYKLYHHGHVCEECKGGRFYRAAVNRCCHDSSVYSVASAVEAYTHNIMDVYRKNVRIFLFASEFMAHKTEEFWGKESFIWRKLCNPYDSRKYRAAYNSDGSVLFFGRLIEEKGVDILVHAASKLPEVSFRVVGDGPDMHKLRQLADELGLNNVDFIGKKWGDEMDAELSACRFVVVPSIWYENYPYVIIQAFAFGKPVIGSSRGGIPELVQHGVRGLIYEADDPDALARNVSELWDAPDRTEAMGHAAKEFSDLEFNDDVLYKRLISIYQEAIV